MKQLKLLLIMSALAGVATGVKANYVEFGPFLDTRYAANTYPALTAVIEDVDNDTVAVHLKIGAYVTNPDVTEFVTSWGFNLVDDSVSTSQFTLSSATVNPGGATLQNFSASFGDDAYPLVGNGNGGLQGKYDVMFKFQTGNSSPGRFTEAHTVTFTIDHSPAISATDFLSQSFVDGVDGTGYYSAAKVQGVATINSVKVVAAQFEYSSDTYIDPDNRAPDGGTTLILLGIGLFGLERVRKMVRA